MSHGRMRRSAPRLEVHIKMIHPGLLRNQVHLGAGNAKDTIGIEIR